MTRVKTTKARRVGGTNEFGEVYAPAVNGAEIARANEVSDRATLLTRNANAAEGKPWAKEDHGMAAAEHRQAVSLIPKSDPRHAEHVRLAAYHAEKATK